MSEADLTVAEYAAKKKVSSATVYRLITAGQLPATKIGKSIRIAVDAVPSDGAA